MLLDAEETIILRYRLPVEINHVSMSQVENIPKFDLKIVILITFSDF